MRPVFCCSFSLAVLLADHFVVWLSVQDRNLEDRVLNLVIFVSVPECHCIEVLRKCLYQRSGRRKDYLVLSGSILGVEHSVLIEILGICHSITLYKSKLICKCV